MKWPDVRMERPATLITKRRNQMQFPRRLAEAYVDHGFSHIGGVIQKQRWPMVRLRLPCSGLRVCHFELHGIDSLGSGKPKSSL